MRVKALYVRCPECDAEAGDQCVYILSAVPVPGYAHDRYQLERVGKPTRRLHNGRFRAAWQAEQRADQVVQIEMMREFFGRFGSIFDLPG